MSTQAAIKAVERIPTSLLVYPLVSGLVLLFSSPLRFLFPSWLIYPFSLNQSDIFASFLTIVVCSFCLGIPAYLVHPLITGNEGLNHRIVHFFRFEKHSTIDRVELSRAESTKFWNWLRDNKLVSFANLLSIQSEVVGGLITGSEVSFFLNAGLHIAAFMFPSVDLTKLSLSLWIWLFSLAILISSWSYNRYHFRDSYKKAWNELKLTFAASKD